jgi:hypothetical protein
MAESIGKITVSIEAQTAELQSGLQKAEQAVKKSADKMAEGQQSLGKKISGSWTEMSSKLMVMQATIDATASALQAMGDIVGIWGEEGISSSVKLGASIQTVGEAGIPVVSGIAKVGEGLAEIFVQSASKIAEVQAQLEQFNEGIAKLGVQRRAREKADELTHLRERQQSALAILRNQLSGEEDLILQHGEKRKQMREELERGIQAKINALGQLGEPARQMMQEKESMLELFDLESQLLHKKILQEQQLKDEARNAELQKEKDAILAKAKAEADAQKKIANKTMDLQTKLSIMQAKQAGNEDKARELAIASRYEKMKQGATEAQKLIIDQMQAIEMASGGAEATTAGGGGTANISTAIGSFTVASGRMETKKQTSLLKRIADSNEKVAEAVTNNNNGIVVPQ